MFEISDDARELILTHLDSALEGRPELRRGTAKAGLRLSIQRGAAYLSLAFPKPSDRVLTFMGRPLLILDDKDFSSLEGICLTVQQAPSGGVVLSMVPRVLEPEPEPTPSGAASE